MADEAYLLVAGLPVRLKGGPDAMTPRRRPVRPRRRPATDRAALRTALDASVRSTRRRWRGAHGLDRLTKPPGSLGRLEDLVVQLAGITGRARRAVDRTAIVVAAADHGVTAQGVSAYPSDVTAQMVANFVAGGAAINVLAAGVGASVTVVDVGVAGPIPPAVPGPRAARLVSARVRAGTADMTVGPAMTRGEALRAIAVGLAVVADRRHRRRRRPRRDRRDGHRQHDRGERDHRGHDRVAAGGGHRPRDRHRRRRPPAQGRGHRAGARGQPPGSGRPDRRPRRRRRSRDRRSSSGSSSARPPLASRSCSTGSSPAPRRSSPPGSRRLVGRG